ncbi:MAG TPA: MarR family transcriptional regulator, partial [Deltaproteobacteria bacterium]|nr:MarR family transcriptional regulator [Deltaproteobacteria bacterium]
AKLIDGGYVARTAHDSDLRSTVVSLTEKGRAMQKDFWQVSERLREKAYRGLSDEEKHTLVNLLTKIHDNF